MNSITVRILFLFLLGLSLLFSNCGQINPLLTTVKEGEIAVISDPQGATIILDGLETGLMTPDTLLGVTVGPHTVSVVLQGHKSCTDSLSVDVSENQISRAEFILLNRSIGHVVLGEEFTSTTCDPCYAAGLVLDSLAEVHSGIFVVIRYHVWWPPPSNDPFYLANVEENTARNEYYDNLFAPHLFLDGAIDGGRDHTVWAALLSERIARESQIDLTLFNSLNGTRGTITALIVSCSDLSDRNLVIHFVITESEVEYDAPNGENIFHQIMRDMLPDANGERITLQPQVILERDREFTIRSGWNPEHMQAVVFIQDNGTGEILQAASVPVQ